MLVCLVLVIFFGQDFGRYILVLTRPLRPLEKVNSGRGFHLLLQRLNKRGVYSVYYFTKAAITKCHRLCGLDKRSLFSRSSGG